MKRPHRTVLLSSAAALALALVPLSACRSTSSWRQEADRRATRIAAETQKAVVGEADALAVETPGDTLRRRLLLDQELVRADPASLGIRDLPSTELWDPARRLLPSDESLAAEFDTTGTIRPTIREAVRIAAAHSAAFRDRKEALYSAALGLDLEADGFRTAFSGKLREAISSSKTKASASAAPAEGDLEMGTTRERRDAGSTTTAELGVSRKFENGADLSSSLAVDFARMLTGDKDSSRGIRLEASLSIPLLRGSGRLVVREPLTQAERNLVYEVRAFEQYKQRFTVEIVSAYLGVLNQAKQLENQADSYRRVVTSTRRSRRMADAGRLKEYEFDQSFQQELSARNAWVAAQQAYQTVLEGFRMKLGLPPDARVEPRPEELIALQAYAESFARRGMGEYNDGKPVPAADEDPELVEPDDANAGPMEIGLDRALALAFANRLDLQTARDKVEDAQRAILIAEDRLRAEVTIGASASAGEGRSASSASADNAKLDLGRATLSGLLTIDLPFHRTAERNAYRESLISLEKAVRAYQGQEDSIKRDVAQKLRDMMENREKISIQFIALGLAERRVRSTDLLLQSGRAEIRDVLDAQDALLSAQNTLLSAVTGYRVGELELQESLGVLKGYADGSWREFDFAAEEAAGQAVEGTTP